MMKRVSRYLVLIMVFVLIFSGTALAKPKWEDKGKGLTIRERILERVREKNRDFGFTLEEALDEQLMGDEEAVAEEDVEGSEEVVEEQEVEGVEEIEQDAEDLEEEEAVEEAEEEYEGLVRQEEQLRLRLSTKLGQNPDENTLDIKDVKALRKLAIIQKNLAIYDDSKYEEALETVKQLLNYEGERHKAMIIMAQLYRQKGDIENAMATLEEVTSAYPDAKVRAYLAILQEEAGEVEEAVENMEQAVQEEPDNLEYYENLGRMYQKANKLRNMVKVFVKGKMPEFDVPPVIKDGRTLVPVRAISNALGAEVDWDPVDRIVTITKDDKTITLQIDSYDVYVNGVPIRLDVPATIIDGRTMVPGRFVSEAFNAIVHWIGEYQTVVINTPEEEAGDMTEEAAVETTVETQEGTTDNTSEETGEGIADQDTGETAGGSIQQDGQTVDQPDTGTSDEPEADTQAQ